MHAAADSNHRAYRNRPDWRQRVPALLLSLAAVGLIVLALLRLGLLPSPDRVPETELTTFDVAPPTPTAGPRQQSEPATERAAGAPRPATTPPAERPPPAPPAPRPVDAPALSLPGVLILTRNQYAASDIGKLPSTAPSGAGEAGSASGAGADTASAYGPGEGPGGERLFNAEWQVRPTRAQLTGYLPPAGAPSGSWATIACRTAERFKVENCRALGESPLGSGLARAMRQAAWQFRVRPPRIGGRPLVGAWVRIRITFDQNAD